MWVEMNHEFEGQRIESLMWFMVLCLQPKGQDSGLNQYFCLLRFHFHTPCLQTTRSFASLRMTGRILTNPAFQEHSITTISTRRLDGLLITHYSVRHT